jgi:hypothetical protein
MAAKYNDLRAYNILNMQTLCNSILKNKYTISFLKELEIEILEALNFEIPS